MLVDTDFANALSRADARAVHAWGGGAVFALAPIDIDQQSDVAIDWSNGLVPSKSSKPTSRGNADSGKWLNAFVNSNGDSKASANAPIATLKITLPVTPSLT